MPEADDRQGFSTWVDPPPDMFGNDPIGFLRILSGPAHIHLRGQDRSRCRVVVTLLHGNEPSGVSAILKMLQRGVLPAVDVHIFVVNVEAALAPPAFSHRMLPGRRDLNRCFRPPFLDSEGETAQRLLSEIAALSPEAVVDVHNTSGEGASFAVVTHRDRSHDALVALFTSTLIVTDLRLGSLMEGGADICPTVTIECGGAMSAEAVDTAYRGLNAFACTDRIIDASTQCPPLDVYNNPIRLELRDKTHVALWVGTGPCEEQGLTLLPNLDRFNLRVVTSEEPLGFLSGELQQLLTARDARGREQISRYFTEGDGRLRVTKALKLFMVAGTLDIARSDCLFYFVPVTEEGSE